MGVARRWRSTGRRYEPGAACWGISQADAHIPNLLPCVEQAFGFELFDLLCGKAGGVVEVVESCQEPSSSTHEGG